MTVVSFSTISLNLLYQNEIKKSMFDKYIFGHQKIYFYKKIFEVII